MSLYKIKTWENKAFCFTDNSFSIFLSISFFCMLHILFSFPLRMGKLFYYKLNLRKDKMNAVLLIQYMSSTTTSLALGVWHQICLIAFGNSDCKIKLFLAVLSTGWAHSDYITVDFFYQILNILHYFFHKITQNVSVERPFSSSTSPYPKLSLCSFSCSIKQFGTAYDFTNNFFVLSANCPFL